MAQTRTLAGEESMRLKMLDLIAVIVCQAFALEEIAFFAKNSSDRVTLYGASYVRHRSQSQDGQAFWTRRLHRGSALRGRFPGWNTYIALKSRV